MSEPLDIESVWTRQVESGQQPSGADLLDHLTTVHDNNAGFTEAVAWNCRDDSGKNSYELLADIIDPNGHTNVLDLACGSGVLLDLCNQRFGNKLKLSGVDMNVTELQLARERLAHTDIKLHHSTAQDLKCVNDKSIDVILCHWALTLMDPVVPVFTAAKRVLKKKGIFAADIKIVPLLFSLRATPDKLARQVAGFFYASFVLSVAGHRKMLVDLENNFSAKLLDGMGCFIMPVNRLVIRQNSK